MWSLRLPAIRSKFIKMRCHLVKSTAAGIAGCLGMQVQCIIHVIFVIGAMDSHDTTVDDVISCDWQHN